MILQAETSAGADPGGLDPVLRDRHPARLSRRNATVILMLKTGYFARHGRAYGAVSIARFPPKWFAGPRYYTIAPPPELLQMPDWDEYRTRFRKEVLARLDPDTVIHDLESLAGGTEIIMLCFEKDRSRCHRGLVAEWLREKKGITVPEAGGEGQQNL